MLTTDTLSSLLCPPLDLLNALEQTKAKGKAGQLAESFTRLDLVILDELGYWTRSTSTSKVPLPTGYST